MIKVFETNPINVILKSFGIYIFLTKRIDEYLGTWQIEITIEGETRPYRVLVHYIPPIVLWLNGIFPWGCAANLEKTKCLAESYNVTISGELLDFLSSITSREE